MLEGAKSVLNGLKIQNLNLKLGSKIQHGPREIVSFQIKRERLYIGVRRSQHILGHTIVRGQIDQMGNQKLFVHAVMRFLTIQHLMVLLDWISIFNQVLVKEHQRAKDLLNWLLQMDFGKR